MHEKDTYEHLLSPLERRDMNAPVASWRAYTDSSLIKSNIGDIVLKQNLHESTRVELDILTEGP